LQRNPAAKITGIRLNQANSQDNTYTVTIQAPYISIQFIDVSPTELAALKTQLNVQDLVGATISLSISTE
jgi:hypothetical protein